jgi:hypothetical protein
MKKRSDNLGNLPQMARFIGRSFVTLGFFRRETLGGSLISALVGRAFP